MSFKMLIVDDEPIICRGLKDTIPWEKYNIEVIDTAHNGQAAIRKVQDHVNVDLVITDVRMPNMDGLQLASFFHQFYPNIRMIMISGYDEFAYAQKAIQLGVKDYLLKPVNIDELVNRVIKLTREIESEQKLSKEFQEMDFKSSVLQQISAYPERYPENPETYNHIKVYSFISLTQDYMKKVKNFNNEEIENQKSQWKSLIDTTLNGNGFDSISIFIDKNTLLTCIQVEDNNFDSKKILSLLENEAKNNKNLLTFIGSDTLITVAQLKEELMKLTRMISYLHIKENVSIVYSTTEPNRDSVQEYPHKLEENLIDLIFQFENINVENTSIKLFDYFKEKDFFLEEVVRVCSEILIKLMNRSKSIRSNVLNGLDINYEQVIDVNLYNSYQILKELFDKDLATIIDKLNLKSIDKSDWMIGKAEEYIKEYYKSNIRAHEVADIINISPNYFSSLFNQRIGKSFNEYINDLRIEEAKTLLIETPLKVHEIAELVGFQEYKYFVKVFKEFSNLTPMKYRKLMMTT